MRFQIAQTIFELFPQLQIAIAVFSDIDNSEAHPEITAFLHQQEKALKILDPPSAHPKIAAWREAYRTFGAKPSDYHSSVEALAKRVAKGDPLPVINPLVDSYNAISLKYLVPVGGEDLDKIEGDILLTRATGDEEFIALGEMENRSPKVGEVVYKDDRGVICRRFNWREADRTKFTAQTKNALVVMECLPPTSGEEIEAAINELAELVQKCCSGTYKTAILNKTNLLFEL